MTNQPPSRSRTIPLLLAPALAALAAAAGAVGLGWVHASAILADAFTASVTTAVFAAMSALPAIRSRSPRH
jgi:hypothetical protein